MKMKKLVAIHKPISQHWVGDGFPVRTLFSYNSVPNPGISPFLMLDYAGPAEFPPSSYPRGVGEHPHRGFETVTIMYSGEVAHRDSGGNSGTIGPGDVQWMTAASGVVHEEMHSESFTRRGGKLEAAQLWVNLPARLKMSPPRYQGIVDAEIPVVQLPEDSGTLRVIAGTFTGKTGPALTNTPINLWDVRLKAGRQLKLTLPEGHTAALSILRGKLKLDGGKGASDAELAVFEREGTELLVEAEAETTFLVLNGEPIEEPVAGYGPFVMNTQQEIKQALADYQSGRMGHLAAG
jgi:redox-sensitive bicupin YhaK (pirin superfamily)